VVRIPRDVSNEAALLSTASRIDPNPSASKASHELNTAMPLIPGTNIGAVPTDTTPITLADGFEN